MKLLILLIISAALTPLFAETSESSETAADVPSESPAPAQELAAEIVVPAKSLPWVGKLISLGARLDSTYTGGGAIAQGFAIPSLRLSGYGEAGEAIDYRISLSQTREYSSALLPQMLPSEAYVDLSTNPIRNGERRPGADVRLRMGMTAPLFIPWWTSDLSDLAIPDYGEIHKANFTGRDIGAELAVRPFGESLTVALGAFNGSGITSLNTNNSKAFSGHFQLNFPIAGMKVGLGNGTYYMEQSTRGSINYKRNWVSDLFVSLVLENPKISVFLDTFIAEYEDPTRSIAPTGHAVTANVGIHEWLGVFSRYEFATNSPLKGKIRDLQLGPTLTLSDYARAFLIYQTIEVSNSEERSVTLRVRVSI